MHRPVQEKSTLEASLPGGALRSALELRRTDPGTFWHRCLFWAFWVHLALFCSGWGFRDVMPPLCLVFLLLHYRHSWRTSVLRRLPILPLFACLWAMMLVGVVFSGDPWRSFLATATCFNKGLILPFLGMECVRSMKDLKRLVWACLAAFLWVGADGVWQFFYGTDFVMGYRMNAGRITSALGDYCVGNYMALVLVPAAGVWYILREDFTRMETALFCWPIFLPGIFTLIGAGARASMLALAAALLLWIVLAGGRIFTRRLLAALVLLAGAAAFLQAHVARLGLGKILDDGRWDLWQLALAVFRDSPLFGCGAMMYNPAFRALGLTPLKDAVTIEHPHNLYLDLLCSFGAVGAALGLAFLLGVLVWQFRILIPRLSPSWREPGPDRDRPGCSRLWWRLAGLFSLGYAAWLVNGVFGHEFYRMWWLGQAMTGLGVAIGAIVAGLEGEREARSAASPERRPEP